MKWGVLGCGTIGERRSAQLPAGVKVGVCFDIAQARNEALAAKLGARAAKSLDDFFAEPDLEAVIIAPINAELFALTQRALQHGCHVLVEKPAARSIVELRQLKNPHGKVVKIGFNHRFHPAFAKLKSEIQANPSDPIMFIRAQYGNGARLGFEKEWRANVELGGGGELLDQGVHVFDLASVLLGEMNVVAGYTRTHFWNMPVDDNAWGIMQAKQNAATFTFHVSSSEWKNEFRFEVYTRMRKYQWLGLGRSYGTERLLIHSMKPEMGPPVSEEITYTEDDQSWLKENSNFLEAIRGSSKIDGGLEDAIRSLSMVESIYRSSESLQKSAGHPRWWKDREL